MRHNGVSVSLVGLLVGVKIALKHHRVAALHSIFVSLLLLVSVGAVVEVVHHSANENGKDEGDDKDGAAALLLFLLTLRRGVSISSVSIPCIGSNGRWSWSSAQSSGRLRSGRYSRSLAL